MKIYHLEGDFPFLYIFVYTEIGISKLNGSAISGGYIFFKSAGPENWKTLFFLSLHLFVPTSLLCGCDFFCYQQTVIIEWHAQNSPMGHGKHICKYVSHKSNKRIFSTRFSFRGAPRPHARYAIVH